MHKERIKNRQDPPEEISFNSVDCPQRQRRLQFQSNRLEADCLESSTAEKKRETWWTTSWTWGINAFLRPLANSILGCIRESTASRSRKVIPPSTNHWCNHILSIVSTLGLPSTRKTWTNWSKSTKQPQRWSTNWSIWHTRRGWGSWSSLASRRDRTGVIFSTCISTWWGWWEEVKMTEPHSSQWYTVEEWEAMGRKWSTGHYT